MSTLDALELAGLTGYAGLPADGLLPWSDGDLNREWRFDFHFPRGVLPLSTGLVDAAMGRASAVAAAEIEELASAGLESRIAGIYVYTTAVPRQQTPSDGLGERYERARLFASTFPDAWTRCSDELVNRLSAVENRDLTELDDSGLARAFDEATAVFTAAWTEHFRFMYRLLLVHDVFDDLCRDIGVDPRRVLDALPPRRSRIGAATAELRRLADRGMRELPGLFAASSGPDLMRRLDASRAGRAWLSDFAGFLIEFGRRSDSVIDVSDASWMEDPSKPLALIEDFAAGRVSVMCRPQSRVAATELAGGLGPAATARLEEVVALVDRADFAWWNEEHNFYIDLRAHLPVRSVGLEAGRRFFGEPRRGLMLFEAELLRLCSGDTTASESMELTAARNALYLEYQSRRFELPGSIGGPAVQDPILGRVFGVDTPVGHTQPSPGQSSTPLVSGSVLSGIGVVAGTVRGQARHVTEPDHVKSLASGEVLICRGTTPAWSDALRHVAACVSESGGLLSHTAIECRARGLVGVVGVQGASQIPSGAWVEVDGTRGAVTIL